jgi:hypothetical protein
MLPHLICICEFWQLTADLQNSRHITLPLPLASVEGSRKGTVKAGCFLYFTQSNIDNKNVLKFFKINIVSKAQE